MKLKISYLNFYWFDSWWVVISIYGGCKTQGWVKGKLRQWSDIFWVTLCLLLVYFDLCILHLFIQKFLRIELFLHSYFWNTIFMKYSIFFPWFKLFFLRIFLNFRELLIHAWGRVVEEIEACNCGSSSIFLCFISLPIVYRGIQYYLSEITLYTGRNIRVHLKWHRMKHSDSERSTYWKFNLKIPNHLARKICAEA